MTLPDAVLFILREAGIAAACTATRAAKCEHKGRGPDEGNGIGDASLASQQTGLASATDAAARAVPTERQDPASAGKGQAASCPCRAMC
jgi:hypothetical protein